MKTLHETKRDGYMKMRREGFWTRNILTKQDMRGRFLGLMEWWRLGSFQKNDRHSEYGSPKLSATGLRVYATRFRREAKRLQLERQVVIEISDAGRIHRQVLDRLCFQWLSLAGRERNQRVVLLWEDRKTTRLAS